MDKVTARKLGLQHRKQLSSSLRKQKSFEIFEALKDDIDQSEVVGCYVSMKEEVETNDILEYCFHKSKTICVPKVVGNTLSFYEIHSMSDLKEGYFHVLEPITDTLINVEDIELMIVPLSAYDRKNHRCGYGKGFYDSVLDTCKYKVGIAYQEQEVEMIEVEEHDISLDKIIAR